MRLAIFGANSSTGRRLAEQALGDGHAVTAVSRDPDRFPLRSDQVRVEAADVVDAADVDRVVVGHDAVISILGVPYGPQPVTVLSRGITNVVDAMDTHGVKRLVCVSSRLLAVSAPPGSGEKTLQENAFYRRVMYPFLTRMGRTLYEDMTRMEQLVRASDLEWTIVRPSALYNAEHLSPYHVAAPETPGLYTSRIDLAHALLREAIGHEHVHETVGVFTTDGVPTFRDVLLKEVMRVGSWSAK